MKTLLHIVSVCLLLAAAAPAQLTVVEWQGMFLRCTQPEYEQWTRGEITDAQYRQWCQAVRAAILKKYGHPVAGPRIPSEAEILANQQRKAIEEQTKRLEAIERAILDAEWQRSMDEQRRAMRERGGH